MFSIRRVIVPYLTIIQNRRFFPLWMGQVVSNFGDTLHYVALVVLLFRLTGSGAALATLALAQIVSGLVLAPFAGVLVDRFDRRTLMIAADLTRAVLAAALAFTESAPLALALAVGMTVAGVPFSPAARALLPSLVSAEELLAANTVSHSTEQSTQIVAAALAGALLLTWGTTPAFLLNAASFTFSALMLLRLPVRLRPEERDEHGTVAGFWFAARAGLTYARRDAFVGPLLVIQALAALATGGTSVLLVILSARHLQLPPEGFSWLLLAIGIGALVGPYFLPRRFGADPRLIFWPYVWRGIGDILIALLTPLPLALLLLFLYGVGTSTGAVTYATVLQRSVPDAMRGRVFATLDVIWAAGEIASIGLAGVIVDQVGIVAVYIAGGILLVVAGALGLRLKNSARITLAAEF